ncbi:MAG TPA: serine/threonine-protein kinase [Polyangiaceae bacterium]|jgi:serine/threonine-protein kinase
MTSAVLTVGRYALHHEIASGGMATVHVGRLLGPVGFARTVAIKRLHAHMARNPEFVAMFLDEARLAARIRHPNVVSTLDVVATEGELFVVMEYVPGDSLSRLLFDAHERGEPVPLAVAASIMVDVLHGLHAAHEASDERGQPLNLVHRDVSPHNVLVGSDGAAHVIDFGIAKATGRAQVTREGQLKGKLCYMAPEQLQARAGTKVDRRADVFGAAVVFWEMLTGRRLFDGEDEGEIYGKVLRAEVTKPSKVVGLDRAAADAIVMRGLARSPDRRYATAREMALEIEHQLPLAPASQVGQWVERHGGEALAERARRIAEVEGTGESPEREVAPPAPKPADQAAMATAPGGRLAMDEGSLVATRQMGRILPHEAAHTDTSLVSSELERAPRRRVANRRATAIGLGLAALVVVAVGGLAMRDRAPQGVASPAPPASSATPPVASPDPVATPVPATSVASPDDAVDPSALPLAPAPTRPGRPGSFAPPIRRAPGVDCDPPYTVDANGYRKYKRECANR